VINACYGWYLLVCRRLIEDNGKNGWFNRFKRIAILSVRYRIVECQLTPPGDTIDRDRQCTPIEHRLGVQDIENNLIVPA
jgi:hypothetical protein